MTIGEILARIDEYTGSKEYRDLLLYNDYYKIKNRDLQHRWQDREQRGKTPNWYVPTAYYPTIVDSMAGYLMSDVSYTGGDEDTANELMKANRGDVKDMKTGTYALAYNRAYEIVYNDDSGIHFASIDPLQIIPVYSGDIEPVLTSAIWRRESGGRLLVDVITADSWEYYIETEVETKDGDKVRTLVVRREPDELTAGECPVIEYRTELIGSESSFSQVINYIIALDWAITGNSNEIDRLVDALLVLGEQIADQDAEHMEEWKAITGITKDGVAPYFIDKDTSPEFRRYVTDLLINEIHKHSHVIDWYNAFSSGEASAKALKIRLFDMEMYAARIEKVYRDGIYKRLRLLNYYSTSLYRSPISDIMVKFNRTLPSEVDEMLVNLKGVDWISDSTKQEWSGLDPDVEGEKLKSEQPEIVL